MAASPFPLPLPIVYPGGHPECKNYLSAYGLQPAGEREYSLKNKAGFSRASRPASAKEGDKGKAEACRETALKRAETIKR